MKKPPPQVGLVIRYDFLWSRERDQGRLEGAKHRPCVVVTAVNRSASGSIEVLVAPITHAVPTGNTVAVDVPPAVARHLGFDDQPGFIIASESNSLSWDDPGIIPVKPGKRWAYGRIPSALHDRLRRAMLDLARKGALARVARKD